MILPRYTLERFYMPGSTPGSLFPGSERKEELIICKTLELAWRDNAISPDPNLASCIPEGIYLVRQEPPKESRPYYYFRLVHVPQRNWEVAYQASNILIHPVNYVKDLLGCIAPGSRHADINADGVIDIIDSKLKMTWMIRNMPKYWELQIRKKAL